MARGGIHQRLTAQALRVGKHNPNIPDGYSLASTIIVRQFIALSLIKFSVISHSNPIKPNIMTEAKKAWVKDLIDSEKVVIFSKSSCPFCKMAKDVFDKLNQKYKAIELDERDDTAEVQNILGTITGARSVPRVFVNGEFIGGGTDVKELYESGDLAIKLG